MSCNTNSEYMMKYFDKQANDIEIAQLNKHIKTCARCREEFRNLSEILSCVENDIDIDIEPPADFEVQVMSRIKQLKEQTSIKGEKLLIFLYGVTTVILLIVVAGLISGLKDISIVSVIKETYSAETLSDVSIFSFFYSTFSKFYDFAKGTFGFLYELTGMVMSSYSYLFGLSLAMLLMLQKLFFNLLGRASGRNTE